MSVFEYGCGASTLWWAAKVKEVISIEHDREWYERMLPSLPQNVLLTHIALCRDGDYARKIAEYEKRFDIVVLDGRDRVKCAMNSLESLKESGVIVWDNSDREEYEDGYDFLVENGFRKIEFVGFAPGNIDRTETAMFYRPGNCLGI
jgi:predicted O-methyltransferase YrrM